MKPGNNINGTRPGRISEQGFTRVDLIAVICIVLLVAGLFAFSHLGENGRIARCTHNLQLLGKAFQSYADDHGSALPPAAIEQPVTAWNMELLLYLGNGADKTKLPGANSPGAIKERGITQKSMTSVYACPSDPITRQTPRSYAMSMNDMRPENWPPGPDCETGVGLVWSKANMSRLLGDSFAQMPAKSQREALALIKLSWMPDPANTLLLTELFHADNRLGSWGRVVTRAEEQMTAIGCDASRCHQGRFNYLMLDGHVELLSPFETGSWRGDRGIWTIRGGD